MAYTKFRGKAALIISISTAIFNILCAISLTVVFRNDAKGAFPGTEHHPGGVEGIHQLQNEDEHLLTWFVYQVITWNDINWYYTCFFFTWIQSNQGIIRHKVSDCRRRTTDVEVSNFHLLCLYRLAGNYTSITVSHYTLRYPQLACKSLVCYVVLNVLLFGTRSRSHCLLSQFPESTTYICKDLQLFPEKRHLEPNDLSCTLQSTLTNPRNLYKHISTVGSKPYTVASYPNW